MRRKQKQKQKQKPLRPELVGAVVATRMRVASVGNKFPDYNFRDRNYFRSLPSGTGKTSTVCAPVVRQAYTGSKMLGVSTMHKSNLVPVFSEEEAVDLVKMRRG